MTRRLITCGPCGARSDRRRTCAGCGRWVCLDCIHGEPLRCVDCQAQALDGAACFRARCDRPARSMTWGRVPIPPGGRSKVLPVCADHEDAASERYVLRLIHRPSQEA